MVLEQGEDWNPCCACRERGPNSFGRKYEKEIKNETVPGTSSQFSPRYPQTPVAPH